MSASWPIRLVALTALHALIVSAPGETILIDNFDDFNDDGWFHVDMLGGQPGGPGIFDASSGAYNISSTDVVPADVFGPMLSLWGGSADPVYSNGILRATVRANTDVTATNVAMRFGIDEFGQPGGYLVGMGTPAIPNNGGGNFAFTVVQGNEVKRFVPFDIPGVMVETGEDWTVELGAIDDQITVKAWPESLPEPAEPQIVVTDDTFSTGMFGVGAFRDPNFLPQAGVTSGTFDDISFTQGFPPGVIGAPGLGGLLPPGLANGLPSQSTHAIPEPGALHVLLCGVCLLTQCRRWRKS